MKKIAFFVQWMLCGGVENALISLSEELVNRNHDVTIYVITEKGEFINKIPELIHLKRIPMEESIRKNIPIGGTKVTVRKCMEEKRYLSALKFVIRHKLNKKTFAELNVNLDRIPLLDEKYDIAVNFHMHSPFLVWYLSERVKAEKKYTWIHNDFETTRYEIKELSKYLKCVNGFFAVAQNLASEFTRIFPLYKPITKIVLNIVPMDEIKIKGGLFYPEEYRESDPNAIRILSVGRLEEQKGYDIMLEVSEILKKKYGDCFHWYVLGSGTLKKQLEEKSRRLDVQDIVHFIGLRENPYPYFKNCDIYVQTSLHEGYVTTVTEARIFAKPVVCTDVSGAREQVDDTINGYITSFDPKVIADRIHQLMNRDLRYKFSDKIKNLSQQELVDTAIKLFE